MYNCLKNKLLHVFFSATVDVVSLLTATATISLVGVVVFTLYTMKLKSVLSRKTTTLDYDIPNFESIDRKYETLQRNKADTVGIDTTSEYMEISATTSDSIIFF